MKKLNLEKIYAKSRDITESVTRLKSFKNTSLEEFLRDRDKQDIASFRLIVATEAAIDICLHIASKLINKVPEYYAGCFDLLAENEIIDRDLANRLVKMARFRNLLVHQYWEINYARMYDIITGPDLDDFKEFIQQITQLIEDNLSQS